MIKPIHARTTSQEVWGRPFVRAHEQWCQAFVLELRLRDVPGPVIGERLAEVERHCDETGEPPSEAFGDATGYAREIEAESSPERTSGSWTVAALGAGQVLAVLVGTSATWTWAGGEPLTYNPVQLVCLALVALPLLCLPWLLRPLTARPWVVGTGLVVLVNLAAVGAALAGRFSSATVVPVLPAVVAIGLFAVVLVLSVVGYRELARDDLVTSPLTPSLDAPTRPGRRTALLVAALMPVTYAALGSVAWLFG